MNITKQQGYETLQKASQKFDEMGAIQKGAKPTKDEKKMITAKCNLFNRLSMLSKEMKSLDQKYEVDCFYYKLRAEKAYREEAKEDFQVTRIADEINNLKRELSKECIDKGQKRFDQFLCDNLKKSSSQSNEESN